MIDVQLGAIETRFADIIWENEPLSSTRLTQLALEKLNWKKSTTYTVLKRLCDKGLFCNDSGTVRAVVSRQSFEAMQSQRFVEENFGGSLPKFLAAFVAGNSLSSQEAEQLRRIVEAHEEK